MVRVQVPATSANVGPGFDCLGVALSLYNTIEAHVLPEGLVIEVTGQDSGSIATDESNLVYQSMKCCFEAIGQQPSGLLIRQHNRIPVSRGLGSSAACIVGGLVAANELMGSPLSKAAILELAVDLEGHPDNVAPALLGGMVVSSREGGVTHYVQFPVPTELKFYAAIPNVELSTRHSRASLPAQIPHGDGAYNVGKAVLLVAALLTGQLDKIPYGLKDRLHQPYRLKLIPSLEIIFSEAARTGLNSIFLSGAGPTIMLLDWQNGEKAAVLEKLLSELPESWEITPLSAHNEGLMV